MRAKVKSRDNNVTRAKAVMVVKPDKGAELLGVGLTDLNEELKSLGQYLKSDTYMVKSKISKSSRDPWNQSQGPDLSVPGPPVQCYKCNG